MTPLTRCITLLSLALFSAAATVQAAAVTNHRRAPSTSGCDNKHDFVGETREFTIESSGGLRTYRVHLPSNYKRNEQRPLLIAYHGAGKDLTEFEKETRFSESGVNPNMIAVYPAGVKKHWEGPTYAEKGVDDKIFTSDLIHRLKADYCVDESRVYATGHSNGAGFTGTLACSAEHGGQFAAFAPVSGAFYTDVGARAASCRPARSPLPMMEIHGTADQTIPYEGGDARGGPVPPIPEWLGRWSERNHCSGSRMGHPAGGVDDIEWQCPGGGSSLRHVKMEGQSHKWPGPDTTFDASPAVVKWLAGHTRP